MIENKKCCCCKSRLDATQPRKKCIPRVRSTPPPVHNKHATLHFLHITLSRAHSTTSPSTLPTMRISPILCNPIRIIQHVIHHTATHLHYYTHISTHIHNASRCDSLIHNRRLDQRRHATVSTYISYLFLLVHICRLVSSASS